MLRLLMSSVLLAQTGEPPKSWIDPDTGRRVVRLTDEPGSASLYFNQNGYIHVSLSVTPPNSDDALMKIDIHPAPTERLADPQGAEERHHHNQAHSSRSAESAVRGQLLFRSGIPARAAWDPPPPAGTPKRSALGNGAVRSMPVAKRESARVPSQARHVTVPVCAPRS